MNPECQLVQAAGGTGLPPCGRPADCIATVTRAGDDHHIVACAGCAEALMPRRRALNLRVRAAVFYRTESGTGHGTWYARTADGTWFLVGSCCDEPMLPGGEAQPIGDLAECDPGVFGPAAMDAAITAGGLVPAGQETHDVRR
jgi:hypothetical protein